jgi:hypothetical protein
MKRKILLLTILTLSVALLATQFTGTVYACRHSSKSVVFGVPFDDFGGTQEYRQIGRSNNWLVHASTSGTFIGDIEGSFTADAHWLFLDWAGPEEDPTMLNVGAVYGRVLMTINPATVDGKTGTLKLLFIDSDGDESAGPWMIFGGTGELRGIRGQGTWVIPGFVGGIPCQAFEGQIRLRL